MNKITYLISKQFGEGWISRGMHGEYIVYAPFGEYYATWKQFDNLKDAHKFIKNREYYIVN